MPFKWFWVLPIIEDMVPFSFLIFTLSSEETHLNKEFPEPWKSKDLDMILDGYLSTPLTMNTAAPDGALPQRTSNLKIFKNLPALRRVTNRN
jgi:hypothetical protein